MDLRSHALRLLRLTDPEEKSRQAQVLHGQAATLSIAERWSGDLPDPATLPGRPARPALLPHTEVARRSPATAHGRAVLVHAIAHIEFNAINLALDAVWRFDGMPRDFYLDWMRVAAEEARHFLLLRDHLRADTADRDLYAATKRELLDRRWDDMNDYADAKTEVIAAIKARARAARER